MMNDSQEDYDFNNIYPDDLENLIYFIRDIKKGAKITSESSNKQTSSGFALPKATSFAAVKSSGFA